MKMASRLLDRTLLRIDEKTTSEKIRKFVREQVHRSGREGVVVGMSGGIDSSVVTTLCTEALGSSRVLGLLMPTKVSADEDTEDARQLGLQLDILQDKIEIESIVEAFKNALGVNDHDDQISVGNLMPRIRMTTLYYYANSRNMLVAGTGNRSELLIGYFTKYGDGGVDILPIGNLFKTQVRQIAQFLHLPKRIVSKKPSAGLWRGQTDEEEIGIEYETLDLILYGLVDLKLRPEIIMKEMDLTERTIKNVFDMITRSGHKLQTPPSP